MSLHAETGDPGTLCRLYVIDKLDDAAALLRVAIIVVIVVKLERCRCILVCKFKRIDDVLIAAIDLPPGRLGAVCIIGKLVSALFCVSTVSCRCVAYCLVNNVKSVEKILILALVAV